MWNPQDYAINSSAQLLWAKELINRLNLSGNESVLDLGCGDGKVTAEIARLLQNKGYVMGLDKSQDFINYAKAIFVKTDYPNLEFDCQDARSFHLNQTFDLVFSNAALHWVDDHLSMLQCVNDVLKKDGKLIISCGGKGNAEAYFAAVYEVISREEWCNYFQDVSQPFYYFYGTDEYREWLPETGFEINRIELVPKDMAHQGSEGLAGWIRTTGMPYVLCIPQEKQEAFINEIVETYLAKYPLDVAGYSHVEMIRLEVEARKV